MLMKTCSKDDVVALLRERDVNPTTQRVEIAHALLSHGGHFSAEEVFGLVNNGQTKVSKATVYNTLGLLAERGLIRQVIVDPNKVFYDPNIAPHYHFYDVATGALTDIDARGVDISGLPPLPEGARMEGVDVIVRVRRDTPPAR